MHAKAPLRWPISLAFLASAAFAATAVRAECLALSAHVDVCETEHATLDPTYRKNPALAGLGRAALLLDTNPRLSVSVLHRERRSEGTLLETIYQMAGETGVSESDLIHRGLSGTSYVFTSASTEYANNLLKTKAGILLVAIERPKDNATLPAIHELNARALGTVFPKAPQ